jgi:hypothetical protein
MRIHSERMIGTQTKLCLEVGSDATYPSTAAGRIKPIRVQPPPESEFAPYADGLMIAGMS